VNVLRALVLLLVFVVFVLMLPVSVAYERIVWFRFKKRVDRLAV
jgi:hypothetical protein